MSGLIPPNLSPAQQVHLLMLFYCDAFDESSAVTIHEVARMLGPGEHGSVVPGVLSRTASAGFTQCARVSRFKQQFTVYWLTDSGRRAAEEISARAERTREVVPVEHRRDRPRRQR